MDLRKKASAIQKFGEGLLRFRLIFFVLFIVLYFVFAPEFGDTVSYILSSTEKFTQGLDSCFKENFASHIYLIVGIAVSVVFLFFLRFFVGNLRSALSFLLSFISVPLCVFVLDGSEELIVYIMLAALLISAACFFFLRYSFGKAILPLYIVSFMWTAFSCKFDVPSFMWGAFLVLAAADAFAIILPAGVELAKGSPAGGALVGAFMKNFIPAVFSVVAIAVLSGYFSLSEISIGKTVLVSIFYLIEFFLVLFPLLSIAPLHKLRSKTRSMKI
ncbi:MAG: hypothetical protein M0P13_03705 [Fibrobacteraceae bacterium]|nr:hypothetical protein [Fibrobacteraceae bacterium]